jgi:hypothetical protein
MKKIEMKATLMVVKGNPIVTSIFIWAYKRLKRITWKNKGKTVMWINLS